MSDGRTTEQKNAENALRKAITDCLAAYDSTEGVLTDFLVIGVQQGFDDDGDPVTAVSTLADDLPLYRVIGLIEYASGRYRAYVAAED